MRKPDWRDGWAISVLCTVEVIFGLAYWANDLHRWLAMGGAFIATLMVIWAYKRIRKGPPRNSKGASGG
jgi:hypothetical protein